MKTTFRRSPISLSWFTLSPTAVIRRIIVLACNKVNIRFFGTGLTLYHPITRGRFSTKNGHSWNNLPALLRLHGLQCEVSIDNSKNIHLLTFILQKIQSYKSVRLLGLFTSWIRLTWISNNEEGLTAIFVVWLINFASRTLFAYLMSIHLTCQY